MFEIFVCDISNDTHAVYLNTGGIEKTVNTPLPKFQSLKIFPGCYYQCEMILRSQNHFHRAKIFLGKYLNYVLIHCISMYIFPFSCMIALGIYDLYNTLAIYKEEICNFIFLISQKKLTLHHFTQVIMILKKV